jgi:putative ATP-dependent endonuclease of OLD family
MRIQRGRIRGFRCLRDVEIHFGDVTTLIGPNGVGKSSVLRALDWFFNGTELGEADVSVGTELEQISVEIEFAELTSEDRSALGWRQGHIPETLRLQRSIRFPRHRRRQIPAGIESLTIWVWGYPPFAEIRRRRTNRGAAYRRLRQEHPELDLPSARTIEEMHEAFLTWERAHPEALVIGEVPLGPAWPGSRNWDHTPGTALSRLLSSWQPSYGRLFQFVFIGADMRVGELGEQRPGREPSVIELIIEQALAANREHTEAMGVREILAEYQRKVWAQYGDRLTELSGELTAAVGELTTGRGVEVRPVVPDFRLPEMGFSLSIVDGSARTKINQQGHGFQRALLIASLRLLAEGKGSGGGRTIFLAIEEPELFQHPVQARAFAAVLRRLSRDRARGVQVAYATHSPYFLEPEGFEEIRRMTRETTDSGASARVTHTTSGLIERRLRGILTGQQVNRQLMRVCLQSLPEALFANAVILVEGATEQGLLDGCALREDPLGKYGISVVDVGGKSRLPLAHATLAELGVPSFVIFDGDKGYAARARAAGVSAQTIASAVAAHKRDNRKVLAYLGATPQDYPKTKVCRDYAVLHDTLETYLIQEWPEWRTAQQRIIDEGRGSGDKHPATYKEAALQATTSPPPWLSDIIARAIALAKG